jgi:hypothetical protein
MVQDLKDTILGIFDDNVGQRCYIKKDKDLKHFIVTEELVRCLEDMNLIFDFYWLNSIFEHAEPSRDSWVKVKERSLWSKTLTIILIDNLAIIKQGKNEFKLTETISRKLYAQYPHRTGE